MDNNPLHQFAFSDKFSSAEHSTSLMTLVGMEMLVPCLRSLRAACMGQREQVRTVLPNSQPRIPLVLLGNINKVT